MVANGLQSQPLVNGAVWCSGNPVVGHGCVSPIVNLANATDAEAHVWYGSLQATLDLADANHLRVPAGKQVLLTDLLAGGLGPSGPVSFVAVGLAGHDGPFSLFALTFTPTAGYWLVPAAGLFQVVGGAVVQVGAEATTCVTPTLGVFAPQFCGCAKPSWPWGLIYTGAIGAKCNNYGAVAPCQALAAWAVA